MPLVLGVTGSIAAGKSLLCQHLVERYGATHADADKVVHRMYDPGKPAFDRIVGEFGDDIVGDDGYIDRKVLGGKVFGQPERMRALTQAIGDIGGEMKRLVKRWREELGPDDVAILEAVNLIEAGYSGMCDQTWLVAADDDVALPRLMERNNLTEEEAKQRLTSARDWKLRAPASDQVFLNNGTLDEFFAEIDRVYQEMLEAHRDGSLPPTRYHEWRDEQERQRKEREEQEAAAKTE